jgi:hypothetical protein
MKHTLKIIIFGTVLIITSLTAKAENIISGPALGCVTITQFENILKANKYDAKRAGQMMDEAIATKDCKLFKEGQEVIVLPSAENIPYKRIRDTVSVRGYWVLKGRID